MDSIKYREKNFVEKIVDTVGSFITKWTQSVRFERLKLKKPFND